MKRIAAILLCISSLPLSAATFTVINTDDSGPGSLRQALADAQGCIDVARMSIADSPSGGGHLIAFDVPGGLLTNGVAVIAPLTPLPEITCPETTVDGTTQTANGGNTNDVTLGAGGLVGTGPDGVTATGDEFLLPQLNGPEVEIQGMPGIGAGLAVDADNVTIRGLAIYGFGSAGSNTTGNILVRDAANTLIEGNVLGASATAFASTGAAFANNVTGSALDPQVGSGTIVRNNLIGFSGSSGIIALGPGSLIEGNEIRACGSTQVDDAIATLATPYTIQRNLIVDSDALGIDVGGGDAPIMISENTVSGNGFGSATERCGAFVGSSGGGTISLNVFTGNANAALIPTTTGIRISKNSIYDNGTIGIELVQALNRIGDGVTANDVGDGDGGPNAGQNFPLIGSVEHLGPQGAGSTRILGNFHGLASTTFDLELFANPGCLPFPREFLEGETYLGATQVTTDGSGNAAIDVTLPVETEAGVRISATATDPAGNTSEFSQRIIFSITPASGPATGGTPLTASGTNFADPSTMSIGGVDVPATFVSTQSLTATSPALSPGTFHDVIVTTPANLGVLVNGWVSDFLDVPGGQQFYAFVTTLVSNTITVGVGGGFYGVDQGTKRQQMAVFLLKAKYGLCYQPPACVGTFPDVPCTSVFAPWIEALAAEGITSGCGGGLFCPDNLVTRRQMAVFLLKTKYGSTYAAPACAGVFDDVPCPGGAAVDFIERLAAEQITGGCSAMPPLYCPDNSSTRGQMAVFITKTFGLQ